MKDKCVIYIPNENKCKSCDSGFFEKDGDCHKEIYKCADYTNGTTCQACEDEYYLKDNKCFPGQVTNCKEYNQAGQFNVCLKCNNQFYLENNKCTQQATINNCDVYSNLKGLCDKCADTFINYYHNKKCSAVNAIANCAEYSSINHCEKCNVGFMPINKGLRCITIPNVQGCDEWSDLTTNKCVTCKTGYLNLDGKCKSWFGPTRNCDAIGLVTEGTNKNYRCRYCADTYEPIDIEAKGMCVETAFFDDPLVKA